MHNHKTLSEDLNRRTVKYLEVSYIWSKPSSDFIDITYVYNFAATCIKSARNLTHH